MGVLAVAIAVWYSIYSNQSKAQIDEIELSNVESTAQGEGEDGGVTCNCGFLWGSGCKADNYGARCNPNGSSNCWDYSKNCD